MRKPSLILCTEGKNRRIISVVTEIVSKMADPDQKPRKVSVSSKKRSARTGKNKGKDAKSDDVSYDINLFSAITSSN